MISSTTSRGRCLESIGTSSRPARGPDLIEMIRWWVPASLTNFLLPLAGVADAPLVSISSSTLPAGNAYPLIWRAGWYCPPDSQKDVVPKRWERNLTKIEGTGPLAASGFRLSRFLRAALTAGLAVLFVSSL